MILNDVELWYPKLIPGKPNARFDKENPTWEVQIRTTSKEQKKAWENVGLPVQTIVPDDDSPIYFKVNLRKRIFKADKTPAKPVEVKDGSGKDINPQFIGNGSIGNVRLFQYEYPVPTGFKTASVLTGVQVTRLVAYVPKGGAPEEFQTGNMEVVDPDGELESFDIYETQGEYVPPTYKPEEEDEGAPAPKTSAPSQPQEDFDDDIPFDPSDETPKIKL